MRVGTMAFTKLAPKGEIIAGRGGSMYNRILISTDGSELGQKGVDQGLALAKALGLEVTIVTVTEPFQAYSTGFDVAWSEISITEFSDGQRKMADAILATAKQSADRLGVAAETLHVPDAQIADAIIATARERGCGLIVMASHGRRGLGRLMLGSKTSEVLTHSTIPTLVVR